MGWEWDHISEM